MQKHWLTVCLLAAILVAGTSLCHAEDPGAPDSAIIDISCALRFGSDSLVVPIIVVNDEPIWGAVIPIYYCSPDKYWKIDTAYFRSERWQFVGMQGFTDHFDDHPDTAKYLTYVNSHFMEIPPGRDTIATLHFHKNPAGGTVPDPFTCGFAYINEQVRQLMYIYKPEDEAPQAIFPTGVINLPCNCSMHGDCNGDGSIDPLDATTLVNYVYRQLDVRAQQLGCPGENGDWNCDIRVDPLDVAYIANYVFRTSGVGPCDPCSWFGDDDPPSAIDDLAVMETNPGALTIGWTAPGDDGDDGTAAQYQIRHATEDITDVNWDAAHILAHAPAPLAFGTHQETVIPRLSTDSVYYVAIKSIDDAGNWSAISNCVSGNPDEDFVVTVPDANLKSLLLAQLDRPGNDIYASEMLTITTLGHTLPLIVELTGLEYCFNLQTAYLGSNQIVDIGPLAGLIKLEYLQLSGNPIEDVSPLAGLINLKTLDLVGNDVVDINSLAGLINLEILFLQANNIIDVSAVAGLTELNRLYLYENQVVDLAPLVANTGLSEGDLIKLQNNPLSAQSINEHIPALQARGATVEF